MMYLKNNAVVALSFRPVTLWLTLLWGPTQSGPSCGVEFKIEDLFKDIKVRSTSFYLIVMLIETWRSLWRMAARLNHESLHISVVSNAFAVWRLRFHGSTYLGNQPKYYNHHVLELNVRLCVLQCTPKDAWSWSPKRSSLSSRRNRYVVRYSTSHSVSHSES